jgi:hypothetical protein
MSRYMFQRERTRPGRHKGEARVDYVDGVVEAEFSLSGMSSAKCVDSLQALGARTSCPMEVGLGANFEFPKCRRR